MLARRILALAVALAVLAACSSDDPAAVDEGVPDEAPTDQDATDPGAPDGDDADQAPDGADAADELGGTDGAVVEDFATIVEQVSELRGLPVEDDVPLEVVSSEELVDIALEDVEGSLEQLEQNERIAATLHQIPHDADLLELNEQLLEAGVAGLYVPDEDQAYVVGDGTELSPLERVTVAHEVVHALQDQRIDLGVIERFDDDPDAAMAFSSVIEGDAVMVQEQWATAHLSDEERQERQAEELVAAQEQLETLQSLPPALLENFVTPYVAGPEFVGTLVQEGGTEALDAALEDPPTTMVEIYEPELYMEGFEPEAVELGSGPDGYEQLESWTWGAFEVALMLELTAERDPGPSGAPSAWRGGRLDAWGEGDDTVVAVGWTFADDTAAEEMCAVVPEWYATVAEGEPGGEAGTYAGPDDVLVLDCDGPSVRFALGPDLEVARSGLSS